VSRTAPDISKPRMDEELPNGKGLVWIVGTGRDKGRGKESVHYD